MKNLITQLSKVLVVVFFTSFAVSCGTQENDEHHEHHDQQEHHDSMHDDNMHDGHHTDEEMHSEEPMMQDSTSMEMDDEVMEP